MTLAPDPELSPSDTVANTLEGYASRGVFRGYSRGPQKGVKATYRLLWHRDKFFDFVLDSNKETMRFSLVLHGVPPDSSMYKEFKAFVRARQSDDLPEHRRIDKSKALVKPYNRSGNVSLSIKLKDGDYEYGARKLVHLVHEIFMIFLYDGSYYDYMVEYLDLDPDGV